MSDDDVSLTISFDDADAAFVEALQQIEAEPLYLGDYTPDYIATEDMSSLTWTAVNPIAEYEVNIGFTVADEHISALVLDLRDLGDQVYEEVSDNISNLTSLKELIVALPEDKDMFDISNLTALQYLEISKSREPISLSSLDQLTDLGVLVISAKIEEVPDLSSNIQLQRLVIRSAESPSFPESILKLEKLVWLEFGNKFDKLPDDIVNLENLIVLDLISDNLAQLPEQFGTLSKLQHFSLETDQLETLPETFDQLGMITDLYLWNLPWTTIPSAIFQLETLKYLWFKENSKLRGSLVTVPEEIDNLTNLVDLQLNGHEIETIPNSIGNLKQLTSLNLGINNLTSIASGIFELENLTRLELYLNPIEELPPEISDLKELTYLDISDTKITELPESIAKLRELTDFDALGCDLDGLPESITGWNYTKFKTFLISLREEPSTLSQEIQDWLDKLVTYADENEEKQMEIEISLYVPEEDDKFDT